MNKLIIPITTVLVAMILGGSYFAVEYYKQKSYEKQKQVELEEEDKAKKNDATIEREQKSALQNCLSDAKTDYWAYMKLNGTEKADGVIRADTRFWDSADKTKQDTIDNCNEQYRNKSFKSIWDNIN